MENVEIKEEFTPEEVKRNPKENDRKLKLAQKTFAAAKKWFNRKRKDFLESRIISTEGSLANKTFTTRDKASKFITKKAINLETLKDKLNLIQNADYSNDIPVEKRAIKLKEQMLRNLKSNGISYAIDLDELDKILGKTIEPEDSITKDTVSDELKKKLEEKLEKSEEKDTPSIDISKVDEEVAKVMNNDTPTKVEEVENKYNMPRNINDGESIEEYEKFLKEVYNKEYPEQYGIKDDGTYRFNKESLQNLEEKKVDVNTANFDYENYDDEFNYLKDIKIETKDETKKENISPQNFDANPINFKPKEQTLVAENNIREVPSVVPTRMEAEVVENPSITTASVDELLAMKQSLFELDAKKQEKEKRLVALKEEKENIIKNYQEIVTKRQEKLAEENKKLQEKVQNEEASVMSYKSQLNELDNMFKENNEDEKGKHM